MKSEILAAFVLGFLLMVIPSSAMAIGLVIVDKALDINLTLPPGFEPIPEYQSPPGHDIRYAYKRMNKDGTANVVLIECLGGTIGREPMPKEIAQKFGIESVYKENWKSFELEVFVSKAVVGSTTLIIHCAQVPTIPRAIQIRVLAVKSHEADMKDLTRTLLASLEGHSNWLTNDQRYYDIGYGSAKMTIWIILIGGFVYLMAAWRTRSFRTKAISVGLTIELANQKIRPSWAWYLLAAYLLFATVIVSSFMGYLGLMRALEKSGETMPFGLILALSAIGILAAFAIGGFVMWRRVKCKRRILGSPQRMMPPLPTYSSLPD
jgi:hypothetical protein